MNYSTVHDLGDNVNFTLLVLGRQFEIFAVDAAVGAYSSVFIEHTFPATDYVGTMIRELHMSGSVGWYRVYPTTFSGTYGDVIPIRARRTDTSISPEGTYTWKTGVTPTGDPSVAIPIIGGKFEGGSATDQVAKVYAPASTNTLELYNATNNTEMMSLRLVWWQVGPDFLPGSI